MTTLRFRECGKVNAYSANIEFTVSVHGEHIRGRKAPTENSNTLVLHGLFAVVSADGGMAGTVATRATRCAKMQRYTQAPSTCAASSTTALKHVNTAALPKPMKHELHAVRCKMQRGTKAREFMSEQLQRDYSSSHCRERRPPLPLPPPPPR